jgi:hypothetical protein
MNCFMEATGEALQKTALVEAGSGEGRGNLAHPGTD